MLLPELRQQVVDVARQLVRDGLIHGAQGNISALDRETRLIVITPSAVPKASLTVEDIGIVDPNGHLVEGRWKPTSETPMHTIFYRERADVGAVVHSHAPYATAYGLQSDPLPVVLIEAAGCLGGQVPVAPYRRPGTDDVARIALETAAGGAAVILANHGLLTVGDSLARAYEASLAVEMTSRLVLLVRSAGLQPAVLDPTEVAAIRHGYLHAYCKTAVGETAAKA
ncbi:MAG TPA: class II aldolase/adducin family protein [Anaerolineales bacterium]|nr:class II aldolase/adducin family protein [Anaerolineales bacterium]